MVVSQVQSLYRDENDLFRTVTKRIYEQWNAQLQQWDLRRIEFVFEKTIRSSRCARTILQWR